jgi:hypothetical protein
MNQPRFSIVIPTRERANTLDFAIRSCLKQAFDDYEILVCDNCGSPSTFELVKQLNSPRIRYVRSEVPLAMSDNWELAVSHARGEFVTVIGDDDGLLRHALCEAERLIRSYRATIIRWTWAYYKWPDYASQAEAHRLSFEIGEHADLVQSQKLIRDLIKEPKRYLELPMIYNSFIHRSLIDQLRTRTGRVFKAVSPDVYSGFAFADLTSQFVSVNRPMGICGTSAKSTGQAAVIGRGPASGIAKEFLETSRHSGLVWNNSVPFVPKSISGVVAESYAQLRSNSYSKSDWEKAEQKSIVASMIRDLFEHPNLTGDEASTAFNKIRQWCRDDTDLATWFKTQFEKQSSVPDKQPLQRWCKGFGGNSFDIDAKAFRVTDTDGVAELFENLFGCCERPVITRRPPRPSRLRRIVQKVVPPVIRTINASIDSWRRKAA